MGGWNVKDGGDSGLQASPSRRTSGGCVNSQSNTTS